MSRPLSTRLAGEYRAGWPAPYVPMPKQLVLPRQPARTSSPYCMLRGNWVLADSIKRTGENLVWRACT